MKDISTHQLIMLRQAIRAADANSAALAIASGVPHSMVRAKGLEKRGLVKLVKVGKAVGMLATPAGRDAEAKLTQT